MHRIPPPKGHRDHLRALVFNAQFDPYRGVVSYVRVVDGKLAAGNALHVDGARARLRVRRGRRIFKPQMRKTDALEVGDVGYVIANIKSLGEIDVGDTITSATEPGAGAAAPATSRVRWSIAASIRTKGEYDGLRDALEKLKLNDAALVFEPESSVALGFGFRCGFLGPAAHGDRARAARAQLQISI